MGNHAFTVGWALPHLLTHKVMSLSVIFSHFSTWPNFLFWVWPGLAGVGVGGWLLRAGRTAYKWGRGD